MEKIILFLVFAIILFLFLYLKTRKKLQEVLFNKRSLSSRYGKMTESFMPFLKEYPYNPENFRFLGNPIDGIQFESDKIIFIEFKTGKSQLSQNQGKIKELILKKKVSFEEHRID